MGCQRKINSSFMEQNNPYALGCDCLYTSAILARVTCV